jgi:hypothetical protein
LSVSIVEDTCLGSAFTTAGGGSATRFRRPRGAAGTVDRLLIEDGADRWVVVTGGPGMGKSALLAEWLKRREKAGDVVPHHFIRRGSTAGTIR